ncbi:hypothetical protein NL676_013223 [Syzygium grande]|nr:hypothetical protein NL676_013223 [Syzygium grande]
MVMEEWLGDGQRWMTTSQPLGMAEGERRGRKLEPTASTIEGKLSWLSRAPLSSPSSSSRNLGFPSIAADLPSSLAFPSPNPPPPPAARPPAARRTSPVSSALRIPRRSAPARTHLSPTPAPMAKTRPGLMAKPKPAKRDLDSYTIRGTNKVVRAGDCVLMRPSDTGKPPYVARIEKIESDARNNVKVRVRWYYRPEESIGGRRQFHGAKELFLSDHYDVQSAHTIEGKCIVHSFKNYTKLENVGAEDYYCRFEYKAATGAFIPDRVAVYCKCEMPYNPDDLMVQCEGCKDWYHPACVGMTIEEAKKLEHFVCSECSDDEVKRAENGFSSSPAAEVKVDSKRRKR